MGGKMMSSKATEVIDQMTPEQYVDYIRKKYNGTAFGVFIVGYLEKYFINHKNNIKNRGD